MSVEAEPLVVNVVVPDGVPFSGTVVDKVGKAFPVVKISGLINTRESDGVSGMDGVTDDAGRFSLRATPAAGWWVSFYFIPEGQQESNGFTWKGDIGSKGVTGLKITMPMARP